MVSAAIVIIKIHWGFGHSGSRKAVATDCAAILARLVIDARRNRSYMTRMADLSKFFSKIWAALPFTGANPPLVTVINLYGAIAESGGPGRPTLCLSRLEGVIEKAFKPSHLSAVALAINSPGGSPVQSRLIFHEIRRQAAKRGVPVIAFIEDVGASGGYILALAGDEIYADESSIVGSIGVITASFGFQDAIARLGVERRVYTAGENKSQLDPFRAEDPQDVDRLKTVLDELHEQFTALVRERRGDKPAEFDDAFSGAYWTAPQAQKRGLIDGVGRLGDFMRARFGEDVVLKRIGADKGSLLRHLLSGDAALSQKDAAPDPLGANALNAGGIDPEGLINAVEKRALWARFGL